MIRRLALAVFNRLPADVQFAIVSGWAERSERYRLQRREPTHLPYPSNVTLLPARRRVRIPEITAASLLRLDAQCERATAAIEAAKARGVFTERR